MSIDRDTVLAACDGPKWRVWSKVAWEITGREPTLNEVRLVRDIVVELEAEGRLETKPMARFRSSRHAVIEGRA